MFRALLIDYETWSLNERVLRVLKTETIYTVQERIIGRWKGVNSQGQQRLVPFKNDIWLVSYILDPYYTPKNLDEDKVDKELDIDWVVSLRNIFGKFYSDNDIENSMNELYVMILKEGKWGDQINRLQNSVSISTEDNLKTNVERVILQQDKMIPTRNM